MKFFSLLNGLHNPKTSRLPHFYKTIYVIYNAQKRRNRNDTLGHLLSYVNWSIEYVRIKNKKFQFIYADGEFQSNLGYF